MQYQKLELFHSGEIPCCLCFYDGCNLNQRDLYLILLIPYAMP